ncbi:MAG: helix-turn-helix domain-containing protein [Bryobacteraceae bacterium]
MEQNTEAVTVTVDQAHALIGKGNISRATLYNAIARNELAHFRVGRRKILIPRASLFEFLKPAAQTASK